MCIALLLSFSSVFAAHKLRVAEASYERAAQRKVAFFATFLVLALNHVWEGEVSNRWNEPPYHLL